MPIPDRIKNAPRLNMGLELYLNAWFDLSSCRSVGMGEGQIPWSEVEDYAGRLCLGEETTEDLHHHIRALDTEYFQYRERKRSNG